MQLAIVVNIINTINTPMTSYPGTHPIDVHHPHTLYKVCLIHSATVHILLSVGLNQVLTIYLPFQMKASPFWITTVLVAVFLGIGTQPCKGLNIMSFNVRNLYGNEQDQARIKTIAQVSE